ncbi:MAG: GAF domain-containing protein [Ardenticatenaceae bacterium]|nr:GAF domain-containing protein [Ardenticatenaceae bacterium]
MKLEDVQTLQNALELAQKKLALVQAIDDIRDTFPEPAAMLAAIADCLTEEFDAASCLLYLLHESAQTFSLEAAHDPQQWQQHIAADLLAQVGDLPTAVSLPLPHTPQNLLAAPIIMGANKRLGAILLIRNDPFTAQDVELIETAEDQIDSAIVQGYAYRMRQAALSQAQQRQRELALMEAIDNIRDENSEPNIMYSATVGLLANVCETELSVLFVRDWETGYVELRAANDRSRRFGQMDRFLTAELGRRIMNLPDVTIWEGSAVLGPAAADWQVAAVPVMVAEDQRLGALLLARKRPFLPEDIQLLQTAENQIDSVIMQAHTHQKQQLATKELDTIYRIDHIRDMDLPLDEMLDRVLKEILQIIQAETGFAVLYDRTESQAEVRAVFPSGLSEHSGQYLAIERAVEEAKRQAQLVRHQETTPEPCAAMCLPLILNDKIIGVLGVAMSGTRGFTNGDSRLLRAVGAQIDTAIFEIQEKRKLRRVLGRSVDQRVMERLLAAPDVDILKGEKIELTVLYADLRGSTRLGERLEADVLVEFINEYLSAMTAVILAHEGTLDKFVGDEVMALFGAPFSQPDHALRAVQTSLEMQAAHRALMARWQQERGIDTAPIGIGIATGEVIVGEMGSPQRTDYTAIGRTVNLGARICSLALPGQIIISQTTYDVIKDNIQVATIPDQSFKGVAQHVNVYLVEGLR